MSFYRWNPYTDGAPHRVSVSPCSTPSSRSSDRSSHHRPTSPAALPRLPEPYDAESDSSSSGNTPAASVQSMRISPPRSGELSVSFPSTILGNTPQADEPVVHPGSEQDAAGIPAEGLALVSHFRTLPSDTSIEEAVRSADSTQRNLLYSVLQADPKLVAELCLDYRGNVLCHALAQLPRADPVAARILAPLIPLLPELLRHQHGTIALIRLFDHADPTFIHALCSEALAELASLAVHPYANFVVSRVLEALTAPLCGPELASLSAAASAFFADPVSLMALATNKFGSHVLETWCRCCRSDDILRTAGAIVTNPSLVASLGYHPVGNFPLQSVLRRLATNFPQGHRYTAEVSRVPGLVAESRFQLNIRKAILGTDPRLKTGNRSVLGRAAPGNKTDPGNTEQRNT